MCHVLIIEDEPLVAMEIEAHLGDAGATSFDIAATEREAVELARNRPPRLITSDVRLLEGTGPEAVVRILAEFGHLPVIFITGTPEDCQPCDEPAIVLTKPIQRHQLTAAFHTLDPLTEA